VLKSETQKHKSLQSRILSGSFVLLSGSGLATAINLAYNIAVARFLGPKGFGNATAVYTLLTLISAVTLSFQLISAKIVAQQKTPEGKSEGYRLFHRGAWGCSLAVAVLMVLFQRGMANYLNLADPLLIVLIAIGIAFYVPLGSRRGYLQGAYGFRSLATSLVLEGAIRLGGSLLLILLGMGVRGVIAANSAAIAISYFAIVPVLSAKTRNSLHVGYALRETTQAMVFFAGQVLINNCDIVLVKHFFLADPAGLYAAVAMVGRVIFSFSQAVVNSMFPLVAGTRNEERRDLTVIATSLLLVLGIGCTLALGLRFTPAWIWTAFFGNKFQISGTYNLPYLLALYAITTVIYSLSAVIITYEMSYKIANTSWIQLVFSGVVIAGICLFHSSLREVILVQLVLMIVLLFLIAIPFLISSLSDVTDRQPLGVYRPVRIKRRITEDEVIAEFLRSDFNNPEFRDYPEELRSIVIAPNLQDAAENRKRRALFCTRHLALWNELPAGTEWCELELDEAELGRIRVFPRAQWRKFAQGNFLLREILEGIRKGQNIVDERFLSKISSIRDQLLLNETDLGCVVLIGMNESAPLTLLDGNHRLVAATVGSPSCVHRLRFLCGLSPKMMECCWYNTNFITLLRYARNVLVHLVHLPRKTQLERLLQSSG
jgi:O-antigen/teichoic acid export membrane protein